MARRLRAQVLVLAVLAAACGGSGPPLIMFDGSVCSVSDGDSLEAGLASVEVLNTGANPGEAFFLRLGPDYSLDDMLSDAAAGRFDRFGLEGNDDPEGYLEMQSARFPGGMDAPLVQPFTASSGRWGVVCSDFLDLRSFAADEVIEVD